MLASHLHLAVQVFSF